MADDDEIPLLVQRAQGGDRGAYDELAGRFRNAIYGLALQRLGNREDAQDVTQDVFLQGFQKLGQLRDPRCFPGWLRRITVRLALNRRTRRRPGLTLLNHGSGVAAPGADPMEMAVRTERAAMVRHCLGTLAARDRELLLNFYFGGRTMQDIGREQVIPPGTVKSRLHAARTRLRVRLERAGLWAG